MAITQTSCRRLETHEDPSALTATVTVEGSDTMDFLVRAWANEFMRYNPAVHVSVTAADSGKGIAALIGRTTDLAAASRDLTADEANLVKMRGIKLRKVTVARDAIAVIVNPANPVNELKLSQLKKIFAGDFSNWKELGGPAKKIDLFCREESSGTYKYFQQHVLEESDYSDSIKAVPNSKAMVDAVEKDKWSIGYVGLRQALSAQNKIKLLSLKLFDSAHAALPTKLSTTGDYPISRPLLIFQDSNPKQSVKQFIKFCLSDQGQKVVVDNGYVSVH
jgi:phosphate transport system substrate-binding protein